jgi:hypothetical protein
MQQNNVRVFAKDEKLAKVLKHPMGGRFGEDGSAMWPRDSYTMRRLRDGDITTEDPSTREESQQQQQEEPPKSEESE